MSNYNLLDDMTPQNVVTATEGAAGTSDIESDVVDMAGFDAVLFAVTLGAITAGAVTSFKIQEGDESDLSDAADLEGTAITIAADDDGQLVLSELVKPLKRYCRCVIDRGTQNAVVENVTAWKARAKERPVTHSTTTIVAAEIHQSPVAGTA